MFISVTRFGNGRVKNSIPGGIKPHDYVVDGGQSINSKKYGVMASKTSVILNVRAFIRHIQKLLVLEVATVRKSGVVFPGSGVGNTRGRRHADD